MVRFGLSVSAVAMAALFSVQMSQAQIVTRERVPEVQRKKPPVVSRPSVGKKPPVSRPVDETSPRPTQIGVANSGDILVVLMGPASVKSWSFPVTGNSVVTETKTVKGALDVDVLDAKGVYISFVGDAPLSYSPNVQGSLSSNGNGEDSPVVYISDSASQMSALEGGNRAPMQAFHGTAVAAGTTLRDMASDWADDFAPRMRAHVQQSAESMNSYRDDAQAVVDLTKTSPADAPGSAIEAYLMGLKGDIETHTQDVVTQGQSIAGLVPDLEGILKGCESEVQSLESRVNQLAAADDAEDAIDAQTTSGGPDQDDTVADATTPFSEDQLDDAEDALEACIVGGVGDTAALTVATAPIPDYDETPYLTLASDGVALRDQIYTAADAFRAQMEAPAVEAGFALSAEDELGIQREMLKKLLPLDTTGEIAQTLASLSGGKVPAVSSSQSQLKSGGSNESQTISEQLVEIQETPWTRPEDFRTVTCLKSLGATLLNLDPLLNYNIGGVGLTIGSPMGDFITGGNRIDVVLGLGGNDCILTGGKVDVVFGMKGDDFISTGDHHDLAFGNRGTDVIVGGKGKSYNIGTFAFDIGNLLDGGAGNDAVYGQDIKTVTIGQGFTDVMFGDGLAKAPDHGTDYLEGSAGMNFIFGQQGDDMLHAEKMGRVTLNGTDYDVGSAIFGLKGDDEISGSPSLDMIFGSEDDDTVEAGDGVDFVFGNIGDDTLSGDGSFDIMFGGPGDDEVEGGEGGDVDIELLFGGQGDDRVTDVEGILSLAFGNRGNDTVYGRALITLLMGNRDQDFVHGGPALNLIFGGDNEDTVLGGSGLVSLVSGDKSDDKVFGGFGLVSLMLGGQGDDYLRGDNPYKPTMPDGPDVLLSGPGTDWLDGAGGPDISFGGQDEDVVKGGDWNAVSPPADPASSSGVSPLPNINLSVGGLSNDCVYGEGLADILLGNGGDDRLFGHGLASLHVGLNGEDFSFGTTAQNYLVNTDVVLGDGGVDRMDLGSGPDLAFGFDGQDHIRTDGMLLAFGGDKADRISAGGLINILFGNQMNDHLDVRPSALGSVNIQPVSAIFGNLGNDRTRGGMIGFGNMGDDHMSDHRLSFGGKENDTIRSRMGMLVKMSLIMGGDGADQISTTDAKDFIFGNKGDDTILAGEGKNRVWGGKGNDDMDGFVDLSGGGTDAKDKLRGGLGSNNAWGNPSDDKDKLRNASKDRVASGLTVADPAAPLAPVVPAQSCAIASSLERYLGSRENLGGQTKYDASWMDDFGEEDDADDTDGVDDGE